MKTFTAIVKILTALAAVAGAVYLIATYGDKIVAWAKKMLGSCPCCCDCCDVEVETAPETEAAAPETAEEPAAEEVAEEAPAEEPAVEEIVIEENEPVAAEEDFEA